MKCTRKEIDAQSSKKAKRGALEKTADGCYKVALKTGEHVTFTPVALKHADLTDPLWTAIRTNLLGVEPQSSVTVDVSGTKGFYQISVE